MCTQHGTAASCTAQCAAQAWGFARCICVFDTVIENCSLCTYTNLEQQRAALHHAQPKLEDLQAVRVCLTL